MERQSLRILVEGVVCQLADCFSVKDRAALFMIRDAEERGILVPGKPGIIVEGTAGNTGIGLSLCGNSRGYDSLMIRNVIGTKRLFALQIRKAKRKRMH